LGGSKVDEFVSSVGVCFSPECCDQTLARVEPAAQMMLTSEPPHERIYYVSAAFYLKFLTDIRGSTCGNFK